VSEVLKGGRLSASRKDVIEFISSMESDVKILKYILAINKAHTIMLIENGIIREEDGSKILWALSDLENEITPRLDVEDAHVLVEEGVIRKVGINVGGNLNLAKSRNDQVATALRMALREEVLNIIDLLINLQSSLLDLAEKNLDALIPGYTHLQPAQPTTFAHYLLAQFDASSRDLDRLLDAYKRLNLCPMGAGALATTSFPISRERVAELLGFEGLIENSIDAVSSRDFLLEVLAALSIMAVNLSRFAEDLIMWSSIEFGLIEIPDEFASTSSIMPQKKNPDTLEVIRARMSLIIGDLMAALTILKSLPSTYNLDFQEATPKLWDACNVSAKSLRILSEIVRGLKLKGFVKKPFLDFMAATELANILVRNHNIPFRAAHKIVGALARRLIESGKTLGETTPELLAEVSSLYLGQPILVEEESLRSALNLKRIVESYRVRGGPSRVEVERMLSERRLLISRYREILSQMRRQLIDSMNRLDLTAKSYQHNSKV